MILTILAALTLGQTPAPLIAQGTIAVRAPASAGRRPSPDLPFAEAVESALTDTGFTVIPDADHARYVATVSIARVAKGAVLARGVGGNASSSPVAGAGALGTSVGASMSIGLPSGKTQVGELVSTELTLTITRRGEKAPAWEGRAVTQQIAGTRAGDPDAVAAKLAGALLRNFPSESGLRISVP